MSAAPTRVFLAGTGTPGSTQDHHRDMYRPALAAPDFTEVPDIASADLVVLCPDVNDPAAVVAVLDEAGERPVVIDKPTLLPLDVLTDLAERFPRAMAAHHPRFHPVVTGAAARIRSGGLGLVHAIHGELLCGQGDGPHSQGELRNLAVYALDVTHAFAGGPGPLSGSGFAVTSPSDGEVGEAHTLSLRLQPDVAVTLMVGRSGPPQVSDQTSPLHRYRVLGTHGQLLLDLDSPAIDVLGGRRIPFGPSSVQLMLRAAAGGATSPGLAHARDLLHTIQALEASATSHEVVTFGPSDA